MLLLSYASSPNSLAITIKSAFITSLNNILLNSINSSQFSLNSTHFKTKAKQFQFSTVFLALFLINEFNSTTVKLSDASSPYSLAITNLKKIRYFHSFAISNMSTKTYLILIIIFLNIKFKHGLPD